MFLAQLIGYNQLERMMPMTRSSPSKLPPLRRPLVGHAARICESLMPRLAMTLAQIQALQLPCQYTVAEVGQERFEKELASKRETTRQILEKLVAHGYVQCIRVGSLLLYGAVRERAVVDVAAYYARQFSKEYGDQIPEVEAWKANPQTLAQGYEWSAFCKVMTWDESNLKHHIADMDANVQLTLACAHAGVNQELWMPEHVIKRLHKSLKVAYVGPDGKPYASQLRPDDWYIFSKQVGQGTVREKILLETDNGPQTQENRTTTNVKKRKRSWAHKFRAYHRFFADKHFKRLYGYDNAKVLILTTSERRMINLKRVCEESGGKGRYFFTHTQLFTPANIFNEAIYVRAGDAPGEQVGLFGKDG